MATKAPAGPTPAPSDEDLVRRLRTGGDSDAFEALVFRYEHELFGYLHRYLHDADLAADAFQSTFLRVHAKNASFVEGKRFRPWLYAIATRQAIDILRRERRHRQNVHEAAEAGEEGVMLAGFAAAGRMPDDQAGDREDRQRVQDAVQRLSTVQRRAVQLVYDQGMAYAEAAVVMGVPVGTVKSRLHSALLALERLLASPTPRPACALAAKAHG